MAVELHMRKQLGALRPVDAMGEGLLQDLRNGETVKVVITRPRNVTFHNKFFALLNVLFPHQDTYPSMALFRAAVTCALGFAETVKLPDGRTILVPQSISFAKMDEVEFDALMKRFFDLAETRIIPGINRKDVEREWAEVMAGYKDDPPTGGGQKRDAEG